MRRFQSRRRASCAVPYYLHSTVRDAVVSRSIDLCSKPLRIELLQYSSYLGRGASIQRKEVPDIVVCVRYKSQLRLGTPVRVLSSFARIVSS